MKFFLVLAVLVSLTNISFAQHSEADLFRPFENKYFKLNDQQSINDDSCPNIIAIFKEFNSDPIMPQFVLINEGRNQNEFDQQLLIYDHIYGELNDNIQNAKISNISTTKLTLTAGENLTMNFSNKDGVIELETYSNSLIDEKCEYSYFWGI
jgi:hypothetical protein